MVHRKTLKRMPKNPLERVLKTIRNFGMLASGDRVLVACSGGPDSVFLLHALVKLKRKLALGNIAVCNLDHGLRGKESEEDSLFVRKLSESLGLDFHYKKVDLKNDKPKKLSVEESGRLERYSFFRDIADKTRSNVIATGHTLDDQAETVIMRLIKGASLKGMVGVSPLRRDGDLKIVRPMIEIEKEEIMKYLDWHSLTYRTDRSNLEDVYFRNIVRHRIIPYLEEYNPRLKRVLFNLAEHLREDFEFISEAKAGIYNRARSPKAEVREISLVDIIIQPKALRKEILRDLLEAAGGEIKKLSFRHWKEMDSLITHKERGKSVDLPGGIRITRNEKSLVFSRIGQGG